MLQIMRPLTPLKSNLSFSSCHTHTHTHAVEKRDLKIALLCWKGSERTRFMRFYTLRLQSMLSRELLRAEMRSDRKNTHTHAVYVYTSRDTLVQRDGRASRAWCDECTPAVTLAALSRLWYWTHQTCGELWRVNTWLVTCSWRYKCFCDCIKLKCRTGNVLLCLRTFNSQSYAIYNHKKKKKIWNVIFTKCGKNKLK